MNVDPENQTEAVVINVFDLLELEPPVLPGDITEELGRVGAGRPVVIGDSGGRAGGVKRGSNA